MTGLFDISLIWYQLEIDSRSTYQAAEVLFYFCTETYEVRTVNGTTVTTVTSAEPSSDLVVLPGMPEYNSGPENRYPENMYLSWLGGPNQQNVTIDWFSMYSIQSQLNFIFSTAGNNPLGTFLQLSLYGLIPPGGADVPVVEGYELIKNTMENIAISFTNV